MIGKRVLLNQICTCPNCGFVRKIRSDSSIKICRKCKDESNSYGTSLPKFFLKGETIRQFGYDPAQVSKYSHNSVVWKCVGCKVVKIGTLKSVTGTCHLCGVGVKPAHIISNIYLIDLFYGGSVYKGKVCLSGRSIGFNQNAAVLEFLNMSEKTDTISFKKILKKKILEFSKADLSGALTHILNNKRDAYMPRQGTVIKFMLYDARGLLSEIMNLLGFSYTIHKANNPDAATVHKIIDGSFFFHNRWHHVSGGRVTIS